jgi:hypothetical protein
MNKKLLISSIITVCILVGVSFTSVVGYRSIASDMKASPLFNIRSSRAIDDENKDLSCEYFGKGDGINLLIPDRDSKTALIEKFIDRISEMDDETFERFITSIIYHLQEDNILNGLKLEKIRNTLHQLRNSNKPIQIFDIFIEGKYPTVGDCITFGHGIIGIYVCLILPFIILWEIIKEIVEFIWGILHLNTGLPMCIPPTTVVC